VTAGLQPPGQREPRDELLPVDDGQADYVGASGFQAREPFALPEFMEEIRLGRGRDSIEIA
jgi:hypothetical protein